jgi:DNA-directed RNA polymerase specialized sigma24 family protein
MDQDETNIDPELRRHWAAREFSPFFDLVRARLWSPICNYLMADRNFGLSQSDADDCISKVIERLVAKSKTDELRTDQNFPYPKAYIWRSCINAAKDLLSAKRKHARTFSDRTIDLVRHIPETPTQAELDQFENGRTPAVPDEVAITLVSALSNQDAAAHWAGLVIERSLERLTPKLRLVIDLLIARGFDYDSEKGAQTLGLKRAGTFRERKRRGYEQLRVNVREEMEALGVRPDSRRVEEAIFEEQPDIGRAENEN